MSGLEPEWVLGVVDGALDAGLDDVADVDAKGVGGI